MIFEADAHHFDLTNTKIISDVEVKVFATK